MSRETVSAGKPWEKTISHGLGVITSGRTLYTSGITARDDDGGLVGPGDMKVQIETCFQNLEDVLAAAGADFADVVKFTMYTTDIKEFMAHTDARRRYMVDHPASTLIEISRFVMDDMLVEIEAIVALP